MNTLTTTLHATWLHPAAGPEPLDPNANDNPHWSWALSVTTPRAKDAEQAVGWLCGAGQEAVQLANFRYGEFALYRVLGESRRDVEAGIPNEKAEAILRQLGQAYGPGSVRLCGTYVLISADPVL